MIGLEPCCSDNMLSEQQGSGFRVQGSRLRGGAALPPAWSLHNQLYNFPTTLADKELFVFSMLKIWVGQLSVFNNIYVVSSAVVHNIYIVPGATPGHFFAMILNIHAYKPAGGSSCNDIQYPRGPGIAQLDVDPARPNFRATTNFFHFKVAVLGTEHILLR